MCVCVCVCVCVLPIVGIVVTTSPSFSLYNTVVLPAASRPGGRQRRCIRMYSRIGVVCTVGLVWYAEIKAWDVDFIDTMGFLNLQFC